MKKLSLLFMLPLLASCKWIDYSNRDIVEIPKGGYMNVNRAYNMAHNHCISKGKYAFALQPTKTHLIYECR